MSQVPSGFHLPAQVVEPVREGLQAGRRPQAEEERNPSTVTEIENGVYTFSYQCSKLKFCGSVSGRIAGRRAPREPGPVRAEREEVPLQDDQGTQEEGPRLHKGQSRCRKAKHPLIYAGLESNELLVTA